MIKSHVAPQFSYLDAWSALVPLTMLFASCNTDASTSGVTCPAKACFTWFPLSWPKEWNGATDNTVGIAWRQQQCGLAQWWKRSFQLTWPKQFSGATDDTIFITWCQYQCQWCQWPKGHVAPHFDHLDLRIAVVPLMTLAALCYTDANSNGMIWPKKLCCTSFQLS